MYMHLFNYIYTPYSFYNFIRILVKYKCDSANLTGTFARSKILLAEKLASRALVTPTPGQSEGIH